MTETEGGSRRRGIAGSLAKKVLMPLLTTTVSAAVGYAAKKAPQLLEEKVLPKLKEASNGSGPARRSRQTDASDDGGEIDDRLAERARDAKSGGRRENGRSPLSPAQREQRREERAQRRDARRKSSRT